LFLFKDFGATNVKTIDLFKLNCYLIEQQVENAE